MRNQRAAVIFVTWEMRFRFFLQLRFSAIKSNGTDQTALAYTNTPLNGHKMIWKQRRQHLSILLLKMFNLGTSAIYLKQSFVHVGRVSFRSFINHFSPPADFTNSKYILLTFLRRGSLWSFPNGFSQETN